MREARESRNFLWCCVKLLEQEIAQIDEIYVHDTFSRAFQLQLSVIYVHEHIKCAKNLSFFNIALFKPHQFFNSRINFSTFE
jgi:hypothetical protein